MEKKPEDFYAAALGLPVELPSTGKQVIKCHQRLPLLLLSELRNVAFRQSEVQVPLVGQEIWQQKQHTSRHFLRHVRSLWENIPYLSVF